MLVYRYICVFTYIPVMLVLLYIIVIVDECLIHCLARRRTQSGRLY